MFNKLIGVFAVAAALIAPDAAMAAASAIATADVNLRAGPSTRYPVIDVIGDGHNVRIFGCLGNRSWCDVSYAGQRGWMSSNYLAVRDNGRRYTGSRIVPSIGAPVISFSFGSYWGDHYRHRSFYRDRSRWDHRNDRWDRHDGSDRDDRDRWDRRDDRRDVRDARRELRKERRDVKKARRELRQEQRAGGDVREARRELRKERAERREAKRELRRERRD